MKMNVLTRELLEYYYLKSFHNLKTGLDKVTPIKFSSIRENEYDLILRKINKGKYRFTRLKSLVLPNNRVVFIPTIRDRLVLDYLKDSLNTKYRIKYRDRDDIIKTIKSKLSIQMDYYVLRIDIKSFFSSIPKNNLLHKLKRGSILSATDYNLIKELLKQVDFGIPQGLSISNPLSEIYLEEFDLEMRRIDQKVNFYCRYVDDILLIFNGNLSYKERSIIKQEIETLLRSFGLELNKDKFIETPLKDQGGIRFEYLGYEFHLLKKHLDTTISRSKVNRFIGKINSCFDEYLKEKKVNQTDNVNLLIERLNFLIKTQFIIKKERHIEIPTLREYYKLNFINTGFLNSYKHADTKNIEDLCEEVDLIIRKRIFTLRNIITSRQSKKILYSISMYEAHKKNQTIPISRFTRTEYIRRIKFIKPSINNTALFSLSFNELEKYYFQILNLDRI
ncbi:reverse transcriptase domain-containing protein [Priestia megaterium]|uniref:reverse transcriptase domain-containing protein n=1 Tax=Priestia megaterium TaxID=1404 RepID=UPI0011A8268A|nr:reverse transcriptase domain-containing protein [Priestia megaterium]